MVKISYWKRNGEKLVRPLCTSKSIITIKTLYMHVNNSNLNICVEKKTSLNNNYVASLFISNLSVFLTAIAEGGP